MYLFKKTSFLYISLNSCSFDDKESFVGMDSHTLEDKVRNFMENLKDSSDWDSSILDKLDFALPFFITSDMLSSFSDKDCMSVSIPSSDQSSMDFVLVYPSGLTSSDLIKFLDRFVFFVRLLGQYSQHYPLAGRLLSSIFNM